MKFDTPGSSCQPKGQGPHSRKALKPDHCYPNQFEKGVCSSLRYMTCMLSALFAIIRALCVGSARAVPAAES